MEEERRLSTYVPLMLLAWGANMNAPPASCPTTSQNVRPAPRPTQELEASGPGSGPPDAIACPQSVDVTKPEPLAMLPNSEALRVSVRSWHLADASGQVARFAVPHTASLAA